MARIIGLDLGTYSVKVVGYATTLRGYQVTGIWEKAVPPREQEQTFLDTQMEAVRGILHEAHLHPDTVVCGVPGAQMVTRMIHLPFTDARRIEQVLPFEVGEQIPFDLDEVVFDHQTVATSDGGADILVAAIEKGEFALLLESLKGVGIDPRVMCLDNLPLLYLANQILQQETQPYAIVDLGHRFTAVNVFSRGGLQYVRTLSRGGMAVTESIARNVGCDAERAQEIKHRFGQWDRDHAEDLGADPAAVHDAIDRALRPLVSDLRQTFQAYTSLKRERVEKIYLCGGTSRLHTVPNLLATGLGVEVYALQPLTGPFSAVTSKTVAPEVVPKALSLGLRAVSGARGPQMNLRTGEFGFKGDFQYLRGRVIQLSVAVGVILGLVCAYIFARFKTLSDYEVRQKKLLSGVTKQTLGREITEFSVAHNRITRGVRASLGALLPQVTALDYLTEISKNIGKAKIDVKRLDIGQKRISMVGEIDTIGALDNVVQSLQQYRCFKRGVRIMKSGKNQLNNRANFQLLITPKC